MVHNQLTMSFPSRSINEGFARVAVSAFVAQLDPRVDELSDVKTAVSEAVTNCIVHAYKGTIGNIDITMKIMNDNQFYIRVRDKGCGIENIEQAMEPLFTTSPEEDRAGLGFAVMESFMDKLHVKSQVGKGTTVVMYKKFTSR